MRRQQGFTLVELMIAVAIVGILGAIAIPAYTEYIAKTKRGDGQAALLGLAQALERTYANTGSYCSGAGPAAACATGAPVIFAATVPTSGGTAYYNLRITTLTATTYTLQAQRTGSMATDKCGTLTVTANGTQDITLQNPPTLTAADCWRK